MGNIGGALEEVIRAALEYVRINNYGMESADSAASAEYALEKLQLAARYLTLATEASDTQPVWWHKMSQQEIDLAQAIYTKYNDPAFMSPTPLMTLVLRPQERQTNWTKEQHNDMQ